MSNTNELSRIARSFQKVSPELFYEIKKSHIPELRDTGLIPSMYAHYITNYSVDRWDHKRLFIAAILHLFCPASLYYDCIVTNRICTILSEQFFIERQGVSNLIPSVRGNMKNVPFKLRVDGLCDDLRGTFKDRPVSSLQVSLFDMGGE